jgi:hypothetical protein
MQLISNQYDDITILLSQPMLLEETNNKLAPLIEKIEDIAKQKLSRIAIPTMKILLKEVKQQPYFISALKILTLSTYAGLLGVGFINCLASVELLCNGNFSSVLSSDVNARVNFANTITNAGALFACITDLPAITYAVYLFVIEKAYLEAIHEALDESYHSGIQEYYKLIDPEMLAELSSAEMREELYQKHILKLQGMGITDFYLRPDLDSTTGALYQDLAPIVQQIDLQIKQGGVPIDALWNNCIKKFKEESCTKRIAKVTAVTLCLFAQALSVFLVLENSILIGETPVNNLFSNNRTEQTNEAFYMTQLGGLYSSFTAFGASAYISYAVLLKLPYQKTMREKINACFAACDVSGLSASLKNALYRIKEIKIRKFF